ncbi:unnamed protein product, partial [Polarella glacialis]
MSEAELNPPDSAEAASLWAQLYGQASSEEKLQAGGALLAASRVGGTKWPVWLFEWLAGGGLGAGAGPAGGKRGSLPVAGLEFLCDLLPALPEAYPLGPHIPLLLAQFRAALGCGSGAAPKGAAAEAPPSVQLVHARLLELLLQRPALSFRPTVEQVLPLFTAAAGLLGEASGPAQLLGPGQQQALVLIVAGCTRMLERALEAAAPKKAFRAVLDALPQCARILAAEDLTSEVTEA